MNILLPENFFFLENIPQLEIILILNRSLVNYLNCFCSAYRYLLKRPGREIQTSIRHRAYSKSYKKSDAGEAGMDTRPRPC